MEQVYHETSEEFVDDDKFYDCAEESINNASTSQNSNESSGAEGGENLPELADKKSIDLFDERSNSVSIENRDCASREKHEIREKYFVDEELLKRNELDAGESYKVNERKKEAIRLKALGNDSFRGAQYEQAAELYTEGLKVCSVTQCLDLRAVLYSNRAVCFSKMDLNEDAIADCSTAIAYDPTYLKPLMRRAQLYEDTDSLDGALRDYEAVLQIEPFNVAARANVLRLAPIVQQRNERLKQEMLDKLKDLGNVFLRPFGLSTDNFQLQPNESGGYSVKMQK